MAKTPKKVTIPMPEFIHEHTKLVDVLTKGTPAQRKKEAEDQTKELKTMTGGVRDTPQGNLRNVAVVLDVLEMDREESFPISKKAFKAVVEANAEIQQRLKHSGELHALSEEWREVQDAQVTKDSDRYKKALAILREAVIAKAVEHETKGKGKPPEERRLFPEQFSKPVRKLMDELSFGPPDVMGSSGDHRVMYAADYDLLEMVTFHGKASVKAFQKKIATLVSKVCVTDIKVGEVTEWNLLQDETYSRETELAHLRRLWQEKVITDTEKQEGERMLKEALTLPDRVAARKKLRFGILRWTPKEVAAGVKMTRLDTPIRLEDAMKSKGITKVDVLAWVKDKYVEVSNIVLWTTRGGKPYAHIPELLTALREDIAHYVHDGNYFKAAKRMLSIAKNRKEVAQQEALLAILNSQLGHISTVVSDLKSLEAFPKCVTDEKKRAELDTLRDSMAKLYYPEFFKAKTPTKLLPALERKLQDEARKKLEEAGFLPLKGLYKATKG